MNKRSYSLVYALQHSTRKWKEAAMGGSQQSKNVTHEMKIYTGDKKDAQCDPSVGITCLDKVCRSSGQIFICKAFIFHCHYSHFSFV